MKERATFQSILRIYENALAYPAPSQLGSFDVSRRLYLASGGALGIVVQHLSEAVIEADLRGLDHISLEALGAVHDGLRPELDEVRVGGMDAFVEEQAAGAASNPFLCDGPELKDLWQARFGPKPVKDAGRTTKLRPGAQPSI